MKETRIERQFENNENNNIEQGTAEQDIKMGTDNESEVKEDEPQEEKKEIPSPEQYINILNEHGFFEHAETYAAVVELAKKTKEAGGQAYLVGGCVRDMLIGKISKDFDIEVHGLEPDVIAELVQDIGKVSEVGKSFGILKVNLRNGLDIDISLPRKESKVSSGHKGFKINTDPYLGIKDACRRRDFTINSMLADPLTGKIEDPFGGMDDLKERLLKITDIETFKDDPLRVLRALQFAGRFGLELDSETEKTLKEMTPRLSELPKERLGEEWKKLLLKSEKPSLGLSLGMSLGILKEIHPEFLPLVDTPQNKEWHSEGDAWIHTLMVSDEAAKIIRRQEIEEDKALVIMLASFCHNLRKQSAMTEDENGKVAFPNYEKEDEELTRIFLAKIGVDNLTRDKVIKLTKNHMAPSQLYINATIKNENMDGTIRRLAERIYPATIRELVLLAEADHLGKVEGEKTKEEVMLPEDSFPAGKWLLEKARVLKVEKSLPGHLVKGQDWINIGYAGGKNIGELIKAADDLRDELQYSREMVLTLVHDAKTSEQALSILKNILETEPRV